MSRIPKTWDEYQYGTGNSPRGSVSSAGGRSLRFDENAVGSPSASSAFLDGDGAGERSGSNQQELRHRR